MKKYFLMIFVIVSCCQVYANDSGEEYGTVINMYNSGSFELRYLDAPRAGSVSGRGYRICEGDRAPILSTSLINQTIEHSLNQGKTIMVRHNSNCLISAVVVDQGTLSTTYNSGSFELRYLDAPRAGSVSGRVYRICDGDQSPLQSHDVIAAAVLWAKEDPNLSIEIRTFGTGNCVESLKIKSHQ